MIRSLFVLGDLEKRLQKYRFITRDGIKIVVYKNTQLVVQKYLVFDMIVFPCSFFLDGLTSIDILPSFETYE